MYAPAQLLDLVAESDYIVMSTPHTQHTDKVSRGAGVAGGGGSRGVGCGTCAWQGRAGQVPQPTPSGCPWVACWVLQSRSCMRALGQLGRVAAHAQGSA